MGFTQERIYNCLCLLRDSMLNNNLGIYEDIVAKKAASGIAKILKDAVEKAKEHVSGKIKEEDNSKENVPDWYGNPMQLDGTSEQEIYLNKRLSTLTKIPWNQEKVDELWNA